MKIEGPPVLPADWSALVPEEHPGETGTSLWRTIESGAVRTRIVEFSAGFRQDHWCPRGHILLVWDGDLTLELRDGACVPLAPGSGFILGDDEAHPHIARSERGARVFIVD